MTDGPYTRWLNHVLAESTRTHPVFQPAATGNCGPVAAGPSSADRLRLDAVEWCRDVRSKLRQGAVCTCTEEYRCALCYRLDFAVSAILESGGLQ